MNPHKLYRWEMLFDTGNLYTGHVGATPFDPNNPPIEYGRPIQITLVPRISNSIYPTIPMAIPSGSTPICNRDVYTLGGLNLVGLLFRIGYKLEEGIHMICVNVKDGSITFQYNKAE